MQEVSPRYRAEQRRTVAGPMCVEIAMTASDAHAASACTIQDNGHIVWSSPATPLYENGVPRQCYATLEPGRLHIDGSQLVAPTAGVMFAEGYVSQCLCGEDSLFAAPPTLTLTFSRVCCVPMLTLVFDAVTHEGPGDVRIQAMLRGATVLDKHYAPQSDTLCTGDAIEAFDALIITFLAMQKPLRRARLQHILFGFTQTYTGRDIAGAAQKTDIDPLTRRLPVASFDFSLVNGNALTGDASPLYDPDNPNGLWRYLGEQTPIYVRYGQQYEDTGEIEWLPGGRYYLTGQPTAERLTACFQAQDVLAGLTRTYYKGVYTQQPADFYTLAEAVLLDANLPRRDANAEPWALWEGLRRCTTTAPLPVVSHRACLQLLAHAACCCLYTDRSGIVHIEPVTQTQASDTLELSRMLAEPSTAKIATLAAVECTVTHYSPKAEVQQVHNAQYTVHGTLALHLSYTACAQPALRVTGADVLQQTLYAAAADIVLTGDGTATVTVSGNVLESATSLVTTRVDKADANGTVESITNALITSEERAMACAQHVQNYLLLRTTLTCDTRGTPEVDPLDVLTVQSRFGAAQPARVLVCETRYSGGVSGRIKAKRMVMG